jgi:putative SOS response-associated peptidase YedK
MCGRVRLSSDFSEIRIKLKFDADSPAPNYPPDWNIPPTGRMLIAVRSVDGKRVAKVTKWGLIPRWAKDEKIAYSTHNARPEDFTTKPTFRDAWRRGQRCLCVIDGFYEWKKLGLKGSKKQAYSIGMADNGPMVMAGLWDTWKSPTSGEEIVTCTVLTCGPNKSLGEIHDRMPVILAEANWPKRLGEEPAIEQELLALLRPCPDESLKIWSVDNKVGNVRNTGPQLIRPLEPEPERLL